MLEATVQYQKQRFERRLTFGEEQGEEDGSVYGVALDTG